MKLVFPVGFRPAVPKITSAIPSFRITSITLSGIPSLVKGKAKKVSGSAFLLTAVLAAASGCNTTLSFNREININVTCTKPIEINGHRLEMELPKEQIKLSIVNPNSVIT